MKKYEGDYGIYLRKSRVDVELEKYEGVDTLDRHEELLMQYAKDHNLYVGHIYKEIVSGESIAERPVMQEVIEDVENKEWKGILAVEVERLARGDTADQGIVANTFKYSHTKILTPLKIYDPDDEFDEEYFEFNLFMSRREYKVINRRLQRGRLISVNEGKYVGNIPPTGYRRIKLDNDKGYSLEPDSEELNTVQLIFDLFAYESLSTDEIANKLDMMGIKPRKSEYWSPSTIKDILNNPVYVGKIRWNARKQEISTKDGKRVKSRPRNSNYLLVDGLHKPIIDKEIWDIVQSKRALNNPPVPHNNVVKNSLAGIVYCAKCGKPMQRRPYNKADKPETLMCSNSRCDNISSKLYIVEDKIIQALKIWLKNYKIDYEELISKNKSITGITANRQLEQIEKRLTKEKSKLNKIYECFEDGTYTKMEFTERLSVVKSQIKELEDKINPLKLKVIQEEKADKEKQFIIPKIENVLDLYYKLDSNEEKNKLLKSIVEKVTYLKTEKSIKKDSDPTNFEIHIYPKIPRSK